MVTIKDGCGCDPCDCDWKQKLKEAYSRAIQSVNKIGDNDGSVYFPDGTGFVKLPLPRQSDVAQIKTNTQDIADLKAADIRLQAKDENLDSDIARIDSTDARQSELIQDNADRINSTYNELVTTEATVATHNSEIIMLKANNQALAKSLVTDVLMTDGTTAGSVQVSIEREDGTLITSANYRWGKDIGIRLEAGTQAGYVKAVISLSDGTELVSNEYKIVEVLESDVYVTAITLIADQAAGTLGGNISYSNGTTQTINSVSVPTAPGVTSAIETLQGRMTAVEQKNADQDASITAIDGRVQALENTPGIGQFTNGKLGTIAGSTTDGRVKAETDGSGSVNGWSELKQRVTTAEGQITTAQNDISAIETKNTQQDTAIAGKVAISQGTGNAGKALIIGPDGNVTPGEISGGEVWEDINLANIQGYNWVNGDIVRVEFTISTSKTSPYLVADNTKSVIVTFSIPSVSSNYEADIPLLMKLGETDSGSTTASRLQIVYLEHVRGYFFGGNGTEIFLLKGAIVNKDYGSSQKITPSNISSYVRHMWRLKK